LLKKVIRIISGISKYTSCRQVFKDYNILTVSSLYLLEVICFVKKHKESLEQNIHIHAHNMKKTGFTCSVLQYSSLQKKCSKYGNQLYNKVPDHIKVRENFKLIKRDLKSFLLQHSFYSVDEFMEFRCLGL
jgi:hypothetical protein